MWVSHQNHQNRTGKIVGVNIKCNELMNIRQLTVSGHRQNWYADILQMCVKDNPELSISIPFDVVCKKQCGGFFNALKELSFLHFK